MVVQLIVVIASAAVMIDLGSFIILLSAVRLLSVVNDHLLKAMVFVNSEYGGLSLNCLAFLYHLKYVG